MKLTIAQINPTIGALTHNIELMRQAAFQAERDNSEVIIFPELSLTAYYPADLLDDVSFQVRLSEAFEQLIAVTRETPTLHWVVGAPTINHHVGKLFHNSLVIIQNGKVLLTYHKQLLPTYNVFDERRHFEPGPMAAPILTIGDTKVGVLICEDGWNDQGEDYLVNPFEHLQSANPDLIISINASPSHLNKRNHRHAIFSKACTRHNLPLVYVNQVGGHDQLIYDGASFVVTPDGKIVYEANRFNEDITSLEFMPSSRTFFAADGNVMPEVLTDGLTIMEFYRRQIVLGLKDYARRCGFTRAVVGSSGGIDSALTLALAVEALGKDNVVGITMPSEYSSEGSVSDSEVLCQNLGIQLLTHPIASMVESYKAQFQATTGQPLQGLPLENLQARIRGTILMEYSNTFGHLLLTTGNKSEISVGYCTLYGDTNGGLGLIGDLYKTEIFELCRHINTIAGKEVIPLAIIEKAPSAELAPGQKDTDSLPPYPVLDEMLKVFIEGPVLADSEKRQALQVLKSLELSSEGNAWIKKIQRLIALNEYKRRQAPPILRVRARAFGSGRQLPIAAQYL